MSNNKQFNDTPSMPMVESSTSGEGKGSSGGQQSNEAGGGTEGEEQEEPSSSSSQISSVEDTLAHFREQWQKELVGNPQKKEAASSQSRESCPIPATEEEQAANLFLKGIQHEQEGELYEAIQYYRRAVQLVPDIEFRIFENSKRKAKDELELESSEEEVEEDENNNDCHDEADEDDEDEDLLTRLQRMFNRAHCVCQPQFDQTATHMSALPMEIILFIFRWVVSSDLDLRSLEVCSRVCRGFYLCSRDPEIWRLACIKVWGVNCGILTKYNSWRQMFIERPRLHFNGCYISKTTYVRSGENSFQDRFYRPWHLVAYFRYLRFFPDGLVLMLTTPDDPISSLGLLRSRTPRNSAILSGHYMIRGNCTTLILRRQDNVKTAVNNRFRRRREFTQDLGEQTFHIELQIQSYKNKVNIQLIWEHYSVITKYRNGQESTSTFDLVSNKFPPFWFSRVKSYTTESENPLQ